MHLLTLRVPREQGKRTHFYEEVLSVLWKGPWQPKPIAAWYSMTSCNAQLNCTTIGSNDLCRLYWKVKIFRGRNRPIKLDLFTLVNWGKWGNCSRSLVSKRRSWHWGFTLFCIQWITGSNLRLMKDRLACLIRLLLLGLLYLQSTTIPQLSNEEMPICLPSLTRSLVHAMGAWQSYSFSHLQGSYVLYFCPPFNFHLFAAYSQCLNPILTHQLKFHTVSDKKCGDQEICCFPPVAHFVFYHFVKVKYKMMF